MLLTEATVSAHEELLQPGWIQIDGGRVTAVGAGAPPRSLNPDLGDLEFGDRIVVPGFVDMHGHGGGGGAFRQATPTRPGQRSTCTAGTARRRASPRWSPRARPTCSGSPA